MVHRRHERGRHDGAGVTQGPDKRRRRRWLAVRLTVSAAALTWTFSQIRLGHLVDAAARIAPLAAAAAIALTFANLLVGAIRWRMLLGAYGARQRSTVPRLARIYLVALFYNTFLPANVGGDVLRGYVTRRAFAGSAGGYLVVAVERIFGLAGLFLLAAAVLAIRPIEQVPAAPWLAAAALAGAAAATGAPLLARRLARWAPGRLKTPLTMLPAVRVPARLVPVLGLSLCTHALVALTGHALLMSIAPDVTLAQSMVLVPVALAAMYLPTVAGLGAREAAFVVLFGTVGVAEADATAASLSFFAVQLLVAASGGLLHLLAPLSDDGDTG